MMLSRNVALIRDLVKRAPVLEADLAEHLDDNFGEILPHVFLADVMRRAVDLHATALGAGHDDAAKPIVDYLEHRFQTGDDQIKDLISAGFVEVLPREGEPGYGLRSVLGPELAAEARRVA